MLSAELHVGLYLTNCRDHDLSRKSRVWRSTDCATQVPLYWISLAHLSKLSWWASRREDALKTVLLIFSPLIINPYDTQNRYSLSHPSFLLLGQTSRKCFHLLSSHTYPLITPSSWSSKCGLWTQYHWYPLGRLLEMLDCGSHSRTNGSELHFNKISKWFAVH